MADLFLWTAPLLGRRHAAATECRTRWGWTEAIRERVGVHFPGAERNVLVLDNLNTHEPVSLDAAFRRARRRG